MADMVLFSECRIIADYSDWSREEWQEYRKQQKGLGGSDVGVVLGVSPYKSQAQLFLEKKGVYEAECAGEAAEWGTRIEKVVAEKFQDEHEEYEVVVYPYVLESTENDFMVANIDRLLVAKESGELGILEIKTTSEYKKDDWKDGKVPAHYMAQLQHYFATTGAEWGFFAVLVGGNKYREVFVKRDNEYIDDLIFQEEGFMMCLETDTAPMLDGSPASKEVLDHLYPAALEEGKIQLDDVHGKQLEQLDVLKHKMEELKKEQARIENSIKAEMGKNKVAYWENKKVTWASVKASETVDKKRLQAEFPEVYDKVKKVGNPSRKFTISNKKEIF